MQLKTATTFDEQIALLEKRGMIVTNKGKAREVLGDIGYYRLGFYWFPFEKRYPRQDNRDHHFVAGTTFEAAINLYYFDHNLRSILTPCLHRVEIHLRTTLIYYASNFYQNNPTWFADPKIMGPDFTTKLPAIYGDIKKNDAIKRHHRKYLNDIYAPAWKALEYMTFGNILFIIDNLKNDQLRKNICKEMGFRSPDVFRSHMQTLRVLRNICAHGHNLFDMKLSKPIKPGELHNMTAQQRSNISGALMVLANALGKISVNRRSELVAAVNKLLDDATRQPIAHIVSDITMLTP